MFNTPAYILESTVSRITNFETVEHAVDSIEKRVETVETDLKQVLLGVQSLSESVKRLQDVTKFWTRIIQYIIGVLLVGALLFIVTDFIPTYQKMKGSVTRETSVDGTNTGNDGTNPTINNGTRKSSNK